MNENKLYISSKVLIGELFNDFNIQSTDFISRFPIWTVNCVKDLKIRQSYLYNRTKKIPFEYARIELPYGFEGLEQLIIDDKKAFPFASHQLSNISRSERMLNIHNVQYPAIQTESHEGFVELTDIPYNEYYHKKNNIIPRYRIDNGWIHTNINYGLATLIYKSLPIIYDSEEQQEYLMIYNVESLKDSIKYYCLIQILRRGYIHPIMNLRDNNPYTNPGIAYDKLRYRARVDCNKFSVDRRNAIADILSTF